MKNLPTKLCYDPFQTFWLVALRVLIGWHFLYEGVSKILKSGWSAYPYLMDSQGVFSDFFHAIAANPTLLTISNYINIIGLTLIGLSLVTGLLSKYACIGGVLFLLLFYTSHLPFIGADYMMLSEGAYLWVDKNLIEIAALMVLIYFPTSHIIGLDRYLFNYLQNRKQPQA